MRTDRTIVFLSSRFDMSFVEAWGGTHAAHRVRRITLETDMTKTTIQSKNPDLIVQTKTNKTNKTTRSINRLPRKTKKQIGLELLKRPQGASLPEIQKALGWQAHSVRGFLAGTAKQEPAFLLSSEKLDNGLRCYRLTAVEH